MSSSHFIKHMIIESCTDWFCKSWNLWHIINVFGFPWQVFPKDSLMIFDISKAILEVIQTGEMQQLERNLLSSSNCSSSSNLNDDPELGPKPFYGLFGISGLNHHGPSKAKSTAEDALLTSSMKFCNGW
jgi:hypothetical protein